MSKKNRNKNKSEQPDKKKKGYTGLNKKQRSRIYTAAFIIIIGLFIILNNSDGAPDHGPYPPHYKVENGKMLKLSDYRGKVVVIDFWATWCPPCRKGIPDLIELKKEYKGKDFEIIGVSLDRVTRGGKTAEDVIPFMEKMGINYPIVWGTLQTPQAFGTVRAIPTTFFLDKNGKVRKKIEGLASLQTLESEVDFLLSEPMIKDFKDPVPDFELPLVK